MRRTITIILLLGLAIGAGAQRYSFTFRLDGCSDTMLYIGRYYRDAVTPMDSARLKGGAYLFSGKRHWERGMYALMRQDRKTVVNDFCIDGSMKFAISGDAKLAPSTVTVKGCKANAQMFDYIAVENAAKKEIDDIRKRLKDPATKAQAEADEQALIARMEAYEAVALHPKNPNVFFDLQAASFTLSRPLHPFYIDAEESSLVSKFLRMDYRSMRAVGLNGAARRRTLQLIILFYRLHIPEFPEVRSLEVLSDVFS